MALGVLQGARAGQVPAPRLRKWHSYLGRVGVRHASRRGWLVGAWLAVPPTPSVVIGDGQRFPGGLFFGGVS